MRLSHFLAGSRDFWGTSRNHGFQALQHLMQRPSDHGREGGGHREPSNSAKVFPIQNILSNTDGQNSLKQVGARPLQDL